MAISKIGEKKVAKCRHFARFVCDMVGAQTEVGEFFPDLLPRGNANHAGVAVGVAHGLTDGADMRPKFFRLL
jgi:hypothetical protein